MSGEELVALIPLVAIVGGLALAAYGAYQRTRLRELAHRERLAMIERGLTPPVDPSLGFTDRDDVLPVSGGRRGSRFRAAGVILVSIGLGLFVLISFTAGTPQIALGVGGAFAVVGAAFLVLASMEARDAERLSARRPPPPHSSG
jgi:hypothetical protein